MSILVELLFELILGPIFEVLLHLAGYVTGCLVVPLFTLGHVRVGPMLDASEPDRKSRKLRDRLRERASPLPRDANGTLVIRGESGALLGFLFWVALAIGVVVWIVLGGPSDVSVGVPKCPPDAAAQAFATAPAGAAAEAGCVGVGSDGVLPKLESSECRERSMRYPR